MSGADILLNPLLPTPALAALAALALAAVALCLWRGARGWALRGLAFLALLAALLDPSISREERDPLSDIGFLVIDHSASQSLEDRAAATEAAVEALRAQAAARPGAAPLELREVEVFDAADGTELLSALERAAAEAPARRIAGAVIVSDGRAADAGRLSGFPGPVHLLLTGREDEQDYRLALLSAPGFGVVGEEVVIRLRIEAQGAAPDGAPVALGMSVDGAAPTQHRGVTGRDMEIALPIAHGGRNVVELSLPARPGELTDRNNRAVFTVNGVRDRLRVLLVSGEPHPGERVWRNLLKADASVDLVHFTILRPPEKQDGTPVRELSLIAFPTRQLFLEKIDEFDLIVFDRYRRRGLLPSAYFANIANYVRKGGAVLLAEGDSFAGVESLYRSPLADILPAKPTARVFARAYLPEISETGARHPVTEGLAGPWMRDGAPGWGRWLRQTELLVRGGSVLMTGFNESPLLVAAREGKGRVALIGSDQIWLWSRGYEGGGPQAELLRRLAHWLMKEPELEEEALTARAEGAALIAERRSLGEGPARLSAVSPSGLRAEAAFSEVSPGRWRARIAAQEQGLWRLSDGELTAVAAVGPAAPKEFENAVSSADPLAPLIDATEGAVARLAADGAPDLRRPRAGGATAGRGWIGLPRREAYEVRSLELIPLAPGWLALLLTAGLMLAAWRVEGR